MLSIENNEEKIKVLLQKIRDSNDNLETEQLTKDLITTFSSSTLQHLNLRGSQIGDKGAIALSKALESNTALQSLDLYNTQIGDEGVTALSKTLKTSTTLQLQNLCLGWNWIGVNGAIALSKALKTNISLQ